REKQLFEDNREFLRIASAKDVSVKVIFGEKSRQEEILDAVKIIESVDKNIPLFLQPITHGEKIEHLIKPAMILSFYQTARSILSDVRVIPQLHKFLKLR
ncbi:MAG: radical SAM protein, partial [Planctomycetota bacterium]